jgi:hypothetical protein
MPLFKKKFKDTKVGIFLKEKAPQILDKVADFIPDKGGLGILKNILDNDKEMKPEDKEWALKLLEHEEKEAEQVTARWQADMTSDSRLSKNARPIILLYSWFLITLVTILNAFGVTLDDPYITLIEALSVALNVAYFSSRGIEKYNEIRVKRGK